MARSLIRKHTRLAKAMAPGNPSVTRPACQHTGPMPGARKGRANHITGEGICLEGEPITSQGGEYA
eukprot:1179713-Prorocentrum_minimum.AAC.2